MAIATPQEAVYYYECSYGQFRLVHFIPPDQLQQIVEQSEGEVNPAVLDDFPDGVDLDCTEPDFEEFRILYGYRPPISPDALQRAFFAMYSTTHNWKEFQGSGFIPSADLEQHVDQVEKALEKEIPEEMSSLPEQPIAGERRGLVNWPNVEQSKAYRFLEQMPMEGIDPGQTIQQQKFSPIAMEEDEMVTEAFSKLRMQRKEK